MKSTTGKMGRSQWLWGLTLMLAVVWAPVGAMADLVVDGGTTYAITGDIINDNEYIGQNSTGTLIQEGFTNTVNNILNLGQNAGANGTYNLSNGSLFAHDVLIGIGGTGTFIQTGGTNTEAGSFCLGYFSGSSGTYNQTGGTTVTGSLFLGYKLDSSGAYNLSGGSLSAGFGFVGYYGLGVFNQSDGIERINYNLQLGYYRGSSATYNLSGGSLFASTQYVGKEGRAIFNQSGGSNTIEEKSVVSGLYLGFYPGSSGTYNLTGGSLSAPSEDIGVLVGGLGVFNHRGGTNNVNGFLTLGYRSGSSGTYNLSGGNLLAVSEAIGYQGLGTFNQSGGSNTLTWALTVGEWTSGIGSYTLSGGTLWAQNTIVGNWGRGAFTQTGGSHTVAGALTLPGTPGRSGAYDLRGGNLTAGTINLNAGGRFSQTGGTLDFTAFNHINGTGSFANLSLGSTGGNSTYTLSGGNLSAGNVYVGEFGTGTFTQNGGNHTVTNTLYLAANPGSRGTYNLSGGLLSANRITVNSGGHFIHTGGTLSYQTLNLQGGDFAGDLVNQGLLTGTGPIFGNVTNAGTVNPGNSPGTLSVVGSYTQTAAGAYKVEVASPSSYDRINVTGAPGTATLAGAVAPTLLGGYRPRGNQVFSGIITATGGVTGSFSSIVNQQITPTLFWQGRYHPSSVDLWVQRNYTDPGLGLNSNQQAVGTMLNGLAGAAAGDLDTVLDAVDGLPASANVRDAFKQISPEKAAALATLGFAGAAMQLKNLAQRTTTLRFANREEAGLVNSGRLGFSGSRLDGLMLAYNGANVGELLRGRQAPPPENRFGVYLDYGGVFGSQKSSVNQTGFDFTISGFTLGADYRLRDNFILGLASGYSHTASGFRGSGGGVAVNTWPINFYGAYFPGSFYAFASLGYALNHFNLDRGINFGGLSRTAKSSTTGHQFNAYGEMGYDLKVNRLVVTPTLTLACSTLGIGGFTESGADSLDLTVGGQTATSLQTGIGGRLTVPLQAGGVRIVPQAYASYQHEFSNSSRGLDARLSQAGGAFNFRTDGPQRDFAVVGASVTANLTQRLAAQVNYNAEVGRGNFTAHYVNAGLRFEF